MTRASKQWNNVTDSYRNCACYDLEIETDAILCFNTFTMRLFSFYLAIK